MFIQYFNKNIQNYKTDIISVVVISYEISEEDMIKLSQEQSINYEPLKIGLIAKECNNLIDLAVDNIEDGRIIEGGLTSDGKFILNQYIVHKGLNEFLKMKQLGGSIE